MPIWAKDVKIGYSLINAKAETVAEKPAFREAFKSRRCLIAADGFYEWKKLDAKTKQPYAITMKDRSLFGFAGLRERWMDKNDIRSAESADSHRSFRRLKPALSLGNGERSNIVLDDQLRWRRHCIHG